MFRRRMRQRHGRRPARRPRTHRRKTYTRSKRTRPNTSVWNSRGIPDQLFCKLNYVDNLLLSTTTGAIGTYTFQSSGFDPNGSGGGHQPRYWDQVTAMYNKYQVLGMKIKYLVQNASSTPVRLTHFWTDTLPVAGSTTDIYAEEKYAQNYVMGIQGGNDTLVIKSYMSARRIHGQKDVLQQDDQQAVTSANPADMFYSNVVYQAIGTGNVSIGLQAFITFYFRMFDSFQQNQS